MIGKAGEGAVNALDRYSTMLADLMRRVGNIERLGHVHPGSNWPVEAGSIQITVRTTLRPGWLWLHGDLVVGCETEHPDLWEACPTGWRVGSNLQLPDARGRALAVAGSGPGLTARALGDLFGVETVTLTAAQSGLVAHTHVQDAHGHAGISHNHTQNSHGHAGVSHNHTQNSHGHAGISHTHTQNSHNHTQDSHNHTQAAHSHTEAAHTHTINHDHGSTGGHSADHSHSGTTSTESTWHQHGGGDAGVVKAYSSPGIGVGNGGTIVVYVNWGPTDSQNALHTHTLTTGGVSSNHSHVVPAHSGSSGSTAGAGTGTTTATNNAATATNQAATATNNATTAGVSDATATNQATTAGVSDATATNQATTAGVNNATATNQAVAAAAASASHTNLQPSIAFNVMIHT